LGKGGGVRMAKNYSKKLCLKLKINPSIDFIKNFRNFSKLTDLSPLLGYFTRLVTMSCDNRLFVEIFYSFLNEEWDNYNKKEHKRLIREAKLVDWEY
jgi:hypothetical protein